MAKLGNLGAAEQLLSELEKMMNGLQVLPGDSMAKGQPNPKNRMQKQIDNLADIMRRQQETLDKTHGLEKEQRRGEKNDQQAGDEMNHLQEEQRQLQSELNQLQQQLEKEGLKPGQSLSEAEEAMKNAQNALGNGNSDNATQNQADALEAMRRGAQDLMGQMHEAMKKAGDDKTGGNAASRDPLGREHSNNRQTSEHDDSISGGTDVQRARRILDEIRKRLGNLTPQIEKEYLERLLKFD